MTEADTCRKYVVPKLQAAGWDNGPHSIERIEHEGAEEAEINDGEILVHREFPDRRKYYLDQGSVALAAQLVDQEHADEMRRALNNLNADLVAEHPHYVCRVTADEGDIGRGHMQTFQDVADSD